jgi:GntR family transcriptional regulator, transcriptional repressor for pyruvate dehydrogenase complex
VSSQPLSASGRVQSALREAIELQELMPGDRLPPEHELAREYGVSRTAVREAVKGLRALGFVTVERGVGTFVSVDVHAAIGNLMRTSWRIEGVSLQELLEVRSVIEEASIVLAVERATAADLSALFSIAAEAEDPTIGEEDVLRLNSKFHQMIGRAGHNRGLLMVTEALDDLLIEQSRLVIRLPGRVAKSNREHRAIVEAIVARNLRKARRLLQDHLAVHEMVHGGNRVSTGHDAVSGSVKGR